MVNLLFKSINQSLRQNTGYKLSTLSYISHSHPVSASNLSVQAPQMSGDNMVIDILANFTRQAMLPKTTGKLLQ